MSSTCARMALRLGSVAATVLFTVGVMGGAGDGGCGAKTKTPEQICKDTSGTWGPGEFWPTRCGDDPLTTKGPASNGTDVCTCPADKPNWTDGTGCRKCETQRELCGRTGGTWGQAANWPTPCGYDPLDVAGPASNGASVCICPMDRPNWSDNVGCQKCDTLRERCTRTGGAWGLGSYWPAPCGDDPWYALGRAAQPGEKVCFCPAPAPNWSDEAGCGYCPVTAGFCTGTALWCWNLDGFETGCWDQKGCIYHSDETCGGIATSCSSIYDETSCWAQRGCGWNPVSTNATPRGECTGAATLCMSLDDNYDMCWGQRGCAYDQSTDSCSGISTSCSSLGSESACSYQHGCTWRWR